MTAQEIAEPNTILRCVVGSGLHGIAIDGTDDRDEMGVCLEPPEYVIGLKRFEQWVYRTQPEGHRSGPGDLDLTVYSLRKWASLALKGNPAVLVLMFAPDEFVVSEEPTFGRVVRDFAPLVASRSAGNAFLGYMVAQKQRLLGERGQMRVKRPELVDAHGYDTKYAGHVLRLGFQGAEYLSTGRLTLPLDGIVADEVRAVRRGEVEFNEAMTKIGMLEDDVRELLDSSPLPERPDYDAVNRLLVSTYADWWERDL